MRPRPSTRPAGAILHFTHVETFCILDTCLRYMYMSAMMLTMMSALVGFHLSLPSVYRQVVITGRLAVFQHHMVTTWWTIRAFFKSFNFQAPRQA